MNDVLGVNDVLGAIGLAIGALLFFGGLIVFDAPSSRRRKENIAEWKALQKVETDKMTADHIVELETWNHQWRLENDRDYYALYGPKVDLVKHPKRKPGHDFMGYPFPATSLERYWDGNFIYVPEESSPIARVAIEQRQYDQWGDPIEFF